MSPLPPHDPLVALWQATPRPDIHHLWQDLQHQNRLHQRLNRSVLAIVYGIAILLIFEEATGRVGSHGILSGIWILGIAIGAVGRRRAHCRQSDALTLNTVSLLEFMLARAKRDLFVARCLYAGVPGGALAGYVVMKAAGFSAPPTAVAAQQRVHLLQTGAGVAALMIMMAIGAILSRARSRQVREFREKLRSLKADL